MTTATQPDTAAADQIQITTPGVYYDLDPYAYLTDPVPGGSLSRSGARLMLSAPAKLRYRATHPPKPKKAFELGHAAHRMALGSGPELVVLDYANYHTKRAQEDRDAAREAGRVPILADENQALRDMVKALREHELAGALYDPSTGAAEVSLFWADRACGIWCRARLDWLPTPGFGRLILPEYKTTRDADPDEFWRDAYRYGYHLQSWWYSDGLVQLGVDPDPQPVIVAQETEAPYLVQVYQYDREAMNLGKLQGLQARDLYRRCLESGEWPGYSGPGTHRPDLVQPLELPVWVSNLYGRQIQ